MASPEPNTGTNQVALALAEALAKHQGKNTPRKLRTTNDYTYLGREVLRVIQNTQA